MQNLSSLLFSDLFLTKDTSLCWYKATPGALERESLPPELWDEVNRLRVHLDSLSSDIDTTDFPVDWNGLRLRIGRMDTANGEIVFVCRRFSASHKKLVDLGFPAGISSRLLTPETENGLIIFMGRTGSGKTTAAVAYCVEWLTKFGGVCWTVENPAEIMFSGQHGKGVCYQTEVSDDAMFGKVIRRMMRAAPNLIMVGEIKDESAAREAIQAATSGHLVVTTFHANDIQSGLARFSAMIGPNGTIADALRSALHLQLRIDNEAAQKRVLLVEPFWVSGPGSDGIRSTLRSGDFHLLKSEIDRQKRVLMSGALP